MSDGYVKAMLEELALWSESANGNLTRVVNGYRLTVFARPPGSSRFYYSIREGSHTEYSARSYPSEPDAIEAALDAVGTDEGG